MDNPQYVKQLHNIRNPISIPDQRYDAKTVQAAQSRQMNSLQGSKRFVPQVNPNKPPGFNALKSQVAATFAAEHNQLPPYNPRDYSPEYAGQNPPTQLRLYDYQDRKPELSVETRVPPPVAERPTGLRHFSTKVCEKVKQKGLTNYNEVADELVSEYFENTVMTQLDVVKQEYDMKNIRRRVYDALNVLLAMNIISKNKKDIRWVGLPASTGQEMARLADEKTKRVNSIKGKLENLQELIINLISYKHLVAKNREEERRNGRPDQDTLIQMPFLVISTAKDTMVDCSVASDRTEYLFSFDKRFEIQDDIEVLKRLGYSLGLDTGTSTPEQIETAKSYLPTLISPYVEEIIKGHKRAEEERIAAEKKQAEEERQFLEKMNSDANFRMHQEQSQYEQNSHSEAHHGGAAASLAEEMGQSSSPALRHVEAASRQSASPVVRVVQNATVSSSNQRIVRPVPAQLLAQVPSSSNGAAMNRQRYFIQKAPQGVAKRDLPQLAVRQVARPYPAPQQGDRRLIASGQPVKYYVAAGAAGQQAPVYKPGMPKVGVRPVPPQSGGPRHVYQPQLAQNRVVQQRVYPAQPAGTTYIRKIIRKVVLPPKDGSQQQPGQAQVQQQGQINQLVPKKDDTPAASSQNQRSDDVPMSSRQSDMLQEQHQDPQFDPYYDPMDMTDEQIMQYQ